MQTQLQTLFWHMPMPSFICAKHVRMHWFWHVASSHTMPPWQTPLTQLSPAAQSASVQHCCAHTHPPPFLL